MKTLSSFHSIFFLKKGLSCYYLHRKITIVFKLFIILYEKISCPQNQITCNSEHQQKKFNFQFRLEENSDILFYIWYDN